MHPSVRHIVLDIEGTTCPVSFVSEVLFPYAAREVGRYLTSHSEESDIRRLLAELQASWTQEQDPEAIVLLSDSGLVGTGHPSLNEDGASLEASETAEAMLPYIHWLIRHDRKVTAWKDLQGRIWKEGYARGELKASLFPEVAHTLQRWKQMGFGLSVYSSGSVPAQQLLYGHSDEGDLRPLFSHWFDTRIGAKQEVSSYQAILQVLGCHPAEVLFISDSTAELTAARSAGFQVVFSDRQGNPCRDAGCYTRITTLDQVNPNLLA